LDRIFGVRAVRASEIYFLHFEQNLIEIFRGVLISDREMKVENEAKI